MSVTTLPNHLHDIMNGENEAINATQPTKSSLDLIAGMQLWIPSKDVDADIGFFEKLGYEIKYSEDGTTVLMSDGAFAVQLMPSPEFESPFFGFYVNDLELIGNQMASKGLVPLIGDSITSVGITCLHQTGGIEVTLSPLPEDGAPHLFSKMTNEQEVCLLFETEEEFNKAKAFWEDFGFTQDMTYPSDGWARMSLPTANGPVNIGLYAKRVIEHAFDSPVLCYFGKDMEAKIKALQADGFVFHELPMSKPDSTPYAVALSPGGIMFFLFTM